VLLVPPDVLDLLDGLLDDLPAGFDALADGCLPAYKVSVVWLRSVYWTTHM